MTDLQLALQTAAGGPRRARRARPETGHQTGATAGPASTAAGALDAAVTALRAPFELDVSVAGRAAIAGAYPELVPETFDTLDNLLDMPAHLDPAPAVAATGLPAAGDAGAVRDALRRLAGFGLDGAAPASPAGSGAASWRAIDQWSGGGGPKRARQAQGVRTIAEELVAAGERHIVVMGDLNEGPTVLGQPAANLATLLDPNGPLVEVYALPSFDPGPRPGTFQSCGIRNRLDYILVSHDLAGLVVGGGIERRGLWGTPTNVNPPADWDIYPQITGAHQAASDHAAIYVDINI